MLALAAASAALPFALYDDGAGTKRIYLGTDTRAVGMLLGAVAALTWHRRRSTGAGSPAATLRAWVGLTLVLGFLLTVGDILLESLAGPALLALAAMQVVPYLVDRPTSIIPRLFDTRALVWLGQRSYAGYLWHYLFATWLNPLSPGVSRPAGVGASLAAAWDSWRWVEAPALRYAQRFRPEAPVNGSEDVPAPRRTALAA